MSTSTKPQLAVEVHHSNAPGSLSVKGVTITVGAVEFDFIVTKDGGLQVNADRALLVEMRASNSFVMHPQEG